MLEQFFFIALSWLLLSFPKQMNLPTSRSVYAGESVTDHDELIRFLKFQQEQIEQLTAHVREISMELALAKNGCVTLSTASNNGHQDIFDSPGTEKAKTTPSQIAWQAPPPELRAQWRAKAPRIRDGGITREDWLMDRAACWAFNQCELKIQAVNDAVRLKG